MNRSLLVFGAAGLLLLGSGVTTAATVFSDNFDTETPGLNAAPSQWTVTNGTVDIIGTGPNGTLANILPGNGYYIDLDGSTGLAGRMTSAGPLSLPGGVAHTLSFGLAGSQRGDINTVLFGIDLNSDATLDFFSTAVVPSAQGLTTFDLAFTPSSSTTTARIVFDNEGGDNVGALLDNVTAAVDARNPAGGRHPGARDPRAARRRTSRSLLEAAAQRGLARRVSGSRIAGKYQGLCMRTPADVPKRCLSRPRSAPGSGTANEKAVDRRAEAHGRQAAFATSKEIAMKRKMLIAASVAAAFAIPFSAGAAGDKSSSGSSGAAKMFQDLDKNKDGFLTKDEVKGTPHDKDFATLDKNRDSKLSRQEHAAAPEHAGDKGSSSAGATSGGSSGGSQGKGGKY